MEKHTLKSMTDFVLEVVNADRPCDRGAMLDEIGLYAEFLQQETKKGMFIPCDENDNPLEIHERSSDWNFGIIKDFSEELINKWEKYQQAKERVFLKDFVIYLTIVISGIKPMST